MDDAGDHRLRQWPCQGLWFDALPSGVMLLNPAGAIVAVNPAAQRILGRSAGQLIGLTPQDCAWQAVTEDGHALPIDQHPVMVCLHTQQPVGNAVLGIIHPDTNEPIWIRLYACPVRDEAAPYPLIGVFTVFEDVTRERALQAETRRVEEQANRIDNEQRLRLAAEAARFGVFEYGLHDNYAYWSPQMRTIFGLPPDAPALDWQHLTAILMPQDGPHVRRTLDGWLHRGGKDGFDSTHRIVRPDGSERWIRIRGAARQSGDLPGERRPHLYGVAVDITEEKQAQERHLRAEAACKEQARQLQLAIEAARLGTWSWELSTDRLIGSDAGLAQIGMPAGTALDRQRVMDLIHPNDRAHVEQVFERALRMPDHHEAVFRIHWPDGSEHWIQAMGQARWSAHGQPEALWGVTRDVTEHKRAEDERARAKERERLVQRQVAIHTLQAMAHELHQPLQSVSSLNGLIQNQLRKAGAVPSTVEPLLQLAIEQAVRAGGVLRELMDELALWGHEDVQLRPHDIGLLVRKAVDRATENGHALRVELQIPPGLPPVLCYDLQTEKILSNLIGNAIEAMRDAGMPSPRLIIRVQEHHQGGQRMALVAVRDHGPGIDPTHATQVFDPVFSTKAYGMGLGLAISRSLARAQGGDLEVVPNCHPGAEFRFTLPLASPPPWPN